MRQVSDFGRGYGEQLDAVGSCIGKNGMRISAILNELAGERVDIIKYSEDIEEYVASALSPTESGAA